MSQVRVVSHLFSYDYKALCQDLFIPDYITTRKPLPTEVAQKIDFDS